jgi:hypothetical protein
MKKDAGHVAHMADVGNVYNTSDGKPQGNGPLGRSRQSGQNNTNLRETGLGMWIGFIWFKTGTCGGLF